MDGAGKCLALRLAAKLLLPSSLCSATYPPLHSLTIRHCRSAGKSCLNSVPHWNSRLLLPPQAAQPSVPQSARASSLVSVDSLSSLFVATGDARIAHLGEGCLATSPASRRDRIRAVTPAKRKPTRPLPNGFRKGRSPFAGVQRAEPSGGIVKGKTLDPRQLNSSFTLSKKPLRCSYSLPVVESSNWRRRSRCLSVSFLGISTRTRTIRSPF